jgi:hypothetical protein
MTDVANLPLQAPNCVVQEFLPLAYRFETIYLSR